MGTNWETLLGLPLLAVLLIWRLIVALKKTAEPQHLITRWVVTAVMIFAIAKMALPIILKGADVAVVAGVLIVAACAIIIGLTWAPSWSRIMLSPLTNAIDGGDEEVDAKPLYSGAQSKRQRGMYQEAIAETRQQLEKFPHDHFGTMLLASIQAENLNDLPGAQLTVERMLQNSKQSPPGVADALNTLADWQLKFTQDPEAARQTLEKIREMFPDTMLAQHASQRIAHLLSADALVANTERERIAMPKRERDIGLRPDFKGFSIPEVDADKMVERYVKQLEAHPLDADAREKLAMLYAEHFHRLDLAVDQLEQLIGQSNVSAKQVARWLNLLATLYIDHGNSLSAARDSLRRIIELFPKTAIAETALNRIAYLKMEMKKNETTATIKLGSYEKNLGLKADPNFSQRD